jgi:DNA helicase II / ATP-dependent DNA helicase PcrA
MHHDPFEGVRVVRRLYDEIEALVIRDGVGTLREVNKTIALRRRYGLPLQAPFITTSTSAVQVMTAHKSKGLEFETVFVPHVQDANWGGRTHRVMFDVPLSRYRDDAEHDETDDERRLLYVALTRAKRRLHLSFARESILGKPAIASRLVTDLVDAPLTTVPTSEFEANFSPVAALQGNGEFKLPLLTLRTLVLARGLSATSLNNLLQNPWDYFYRNLLRVPEVQALHLQFGTVIHGVLEAATAEHTKSGTWPDTTALKRSLEEALRRLPVSTDEYTRLHAKGLEILVIYIEHLKRTLTASATKEELSVKVVFATGLSELPEITLTGKMDRVDLDETGKALRVVDYKTGKPKTRAAIVGETASSDGSYKRQLTFYALLLTLFGDERYETKEGVLSFVEPSPQGAIKEESFTATAEEIEALRIEIIDALKNFLTGEFLTDQKLAEASEYKDLALAFMARSN